MRLFDILDLTRPLAKAARDFDWTEVVGLFPEATHGGMSPARVWILASMVVLGEVTGLSEGEVLSRWPENPYWQAFSGFDQFQWQTPVTQTECIAFRRFMDAPRVARLSAIAQAIRDSKPIDPKSTEPVAPPASSSVDAALALRHLHFQQPQPPQPYKAPPRPDFHSSVKQAYAKSASPIKAVKDDAKDVRDAKADAGDTAEGKSATSATNEEVKAVPKTQVPNPQEPTISKEIQNGEIPAVVQHEPVSTPPEGVVLPEDWGQKAEAAPAFPLNYAQMFRRKPIVPAEEPKPVVSSFGAPVVEPKAMLAAGAPQFDTTSPLVLRAPPGEPVRMEVSVSGHEPLYYQWEQIDDAKGSALAIDGCTDSSLTVALEPEDSMLGFQCRVSNASAPEGVISRTFFIKKGSASQRTSNSFGEKYDPNMFGLRS